MRPKEQITENAQTKELMGYWDQKNISKKNINRLAALSKATNKEIAELAQVILNEGKEPNVYLIPSTVWLEPNDLFKDKNYEGKKAIRNGVLIFQVKYAFINKLFILTSSRGNH
jgi:hypothetical protein